MDSYFHPHFTDGKIETLGVSDFPRISSLEVVILGLRAKVL